MSEDRKILHIVVGGKDWEPTAQELLDVVEQFKMAEADPNGGVIATRHDIKAYYVSETNLQAIQEAVQRLADVKMVVDGQINHVSTLAFVLLQHQVGMPVSQRLLKEAREHFQVRDELLQVAHTKKDS